MISCLKAPTPLTVKSVVPLGIIGILPKPNTVYYIRNFISLSLYSKEHFQLKTKHDFQKAETERSFSEPGKFFFAISTLSQCETTKLHKIWRRLSKFLPLKQLKKISPNWDK